MQWHEKKGRRQEKAKLVPEVRQASLGQRLSTVALVAANEVQSKVNGRSKMRRRIELAVKRGIDVIGSVTGLAVLAVPFAAVALAIKLDSRGPVFFRQERVGLNG